MPVYMDVVIVLNFLVDFFLILGTNSLSGHPAEMGRAVSAAILGGLYGGACLLPGFAFLGNNVWRFVSLGLMGIIAFGMNSGTIRRCAVFVLLSMALGGLVFSIGSNGIPILLGAAGGIALISAAGFRGKPIGKYIPVVLEHRGRQASLTALYDTGNALRDPVTGESVLIADHKTAEKLLDLTPRELADPVMTASARPGFRLIPYRAVGKAHGLLLALRVQRAKIGGRDRSVVVAFAPEGLGGNGEFNALIGGRE